MRRVLACWLIVLVWSVSAAHAATYYLAPNGSDAALGTSAGTAWRTWSKALAILQPGDTLRLVSGHYTLGVNGRFTANCSTGPGRNGTASQRITVMADQERQAWIEGDGNGPTMSSRNCSYWTFEGLHVSGHDNTSGTSDAVFFVPSGSQITLRRLLVHTTNRYFNEHAISIQGTGHLVEENEVYQFHRHGIAMGDTTVLRRNYLHSRAYADLPGCSMAPVPGQPRCSDPGDRGDTAITCYPCHDDVLENNISEGNGPGFDVMATTNTHDNHYHGNISLNDNYGYLIKARTEYGWTSDAQPHNIFVRDAVVLGSRLVGMYWRSTKNGHCDQCTILDALGAGMLWDEQGGDGAPTGYATGLLVARGAARGLSVSNYDDWSMTNVRVWQNAGGYLPAQSDTHYSGLVNADPGLGTCLVYTPAGSAAASQGVGANVLYRYETPNAASSPVLTTTPLWDPTTGAFPCGAQVAGLNDHAGDSCFDVHQRLRVGTGGCALPYTAPAPGGLVHAYGLDEASGLFVDSTGSGVPATPAGGLTRVAGYQSPGAIQLDGTSGYVSIPGLLGTNPQSGTLAAWVKPASGTITSNDEVVSVGDSLVLRLRQTYLEGYYYAGNNVWRETMLPWTPSTSWMHLAFVVSPGHQRLYVNGVLAVETTYADAVAWTLGTNTIVGAYGGLSTPDRNWFAGTIDNVRLYTSAESSTAIAALAGVPQTYHVAQNPGTPATTCAEALNAATPWPTLAQGVACLHAGDTLLLHTGTYAEVVSSSTGLPDGTATQSTTLAAAPGETVEMRGVDFSLAPARYLRVADLDINANSARAVAVLLGAGADHLTFSGTTIRGATQYGVQTLNTDTGSHTFTGNTIRNNGTRNGSDHGMLLASPGHTLTGNQVYSNAADGIAAYGNNIVVSGNAIHDNGAVTGSGTTAGLDVDAAADVQVSNNLVWSNATTTGIHIGLTCVRCLADNNTLYNNPGIGLQVQGSQTSVRNNLLASNGTSLQDQGSGTTRATNLCSDAAAACSLPSLSPTFQSTTPGNANFLKLAQGSRGINEGTTLLNVLTDYAGTSRTCAACGSAYDIGAYEFTGTNQAPTIAITMPTGSATYTSPTQTVTLSGTASDPDGDGTLQPVTWTCPTCTPSSGTASGRTTWTFGPVTLSSGSNLFTVTASDGGLSTPDTLTVTWTAPSNTYYVTTGGNDTTGNGTSGSPWRSIGKALTVAGSGTTIQVGPGTFYERLTPPTNGVTIQGTRGGGGSWDTVIDGTSAVPGGCTWTSDAGGVSALVWRIDVSCLGFTPEVMTADGYAVWKVHNTTWGYSGWQNAQSNLSQASDATRDTAVGTVYYWDGVEALFGVNAGKVYVRFRGGESPATHTVRFAPVNGTITVTNRDSVTLRDLRIQGGEMAVKVSTGATNTRIESCYLAQGVYRVQVGDGADGTVISGNTFDLEGFGMQDPALPPGDWGRFTYAGMVNRHRYDLDKYLMSDVGQLQTHDSSVFLLTATNTRITGNEFRNAMAGITVWETSSGSEINHNTIHNHSDNGVYIDSDYSAATFHHNTLYNCDHLMRFNPVYNTMDWTVYANTFYQTYWPSLQDGGGSKLIFMASSPPDIGCTSPWNIKFYHNSFAGGGWSLDVGGCGESCNQLYFPGVRAINNIFGGYGVSSCGSQENWGEYTSNYDYPAWTSTTQPSFWLPSGDPGRDNATNLISRGWPGMNSLYYVDGKPDFGANQGNEAPPPLFLNPPTNLQVTSFNATIPRSATLGWQYVQGSEPAVAFRLFSQPGCTGTWTQVGGDLPLSPLSASETNLPVTTLYCWQVRAVDGSGVESLPSNTASQTVTPPPPPPIIGESLPGGPAILLPLDAEPSTGEILSPSPVRLEHPVLRDLRAWWRVMPGMWGGGYWYDLLGRYRAAAGRLDRVRWEPTGVPGRHGVRTTDGHTLAYLTTDYSGNGPFTVSLMARPAVSGEHLNLLGQINPGWTSGWGLWMAGSTGEVYCAKDGMDLHAAGVALPAGTWSHLACSWDGAQLKFYQDGAKISTYNTSVVYSAGYPLVIGGLPNFDEQNWNGSFDSIMFYTRALTDAEIVALDVERQTAETHLFQAWSWLSVPGPTHGTRVPGASYLLHR